MKSASINRPRAEYALALIAVYLADVEGFVYQEIADIMGTLLAP